MTKEVTCKVCGCVSPLGRFECPDCGAPLPTTAEAPDRSAPASDQPESDAPAGEAKKAKAPLSPRKRLLRRVAVFLAVCLGLELAVFVLPHKGPPPGMTWGGDGLVTPQGVWDYGGEGLMVYDMTQDGRYALLRDALRTRVNWSDEVLYGSSSSIAWGPSYDPEGGYYLFDGRVLETLDWETVSGIRNNAVFYTQPDGEGTRLCRRDLPTGKITQIGRWEEKDPVASLMASPDGSAVVYRRQGETSGEEGDYLLWRVGERTPVELGNPGILQSIGTGGRSCLFYRPTDEEGYIYQLSLWEGGTLRSLPSSMTWIWGSDDLSELMLREMKNDEMGDWYYYASGETPEPVKLEVPEDSYLSIAWAQGSDYTIDTLKDRFYQLYWYDNNRMESRLDLYYLEEDLSLTCLVQGIDQYAIDPAGERVVYLQDGGLYQLTGNGTDGWERQPLDTDPDARSPFVSASVVDSFFASDDLRHIYYRKTTQTIFDYSLYYWHDGTLTELDFEFETRISTPQFAFTDEGYYMLYNRDLYYGRHGRPPKLVAEEMGNGALLSLNGQGQFLYWSQRYNYEDGENQITFWRLDGAKEPVELEEWYPKEGKV